MDKHNYNATFSLTFLCKQLNKITMVLVNKPTHFVVVLILEYISPTNYLTAITASYQCEL